MGKAGTATRRRCSSTAHYVGEFHFFRVYMHHIRVVVESRSKAGPAFEVAVCLDILLVLVFGKWEVGHIERTTCEEWLSTDSLEVRDLGWAKIGGVLAWLEYDEDEEQG
jgi:hypothetical protein